MIFFFFLLSSFVDLILSPLNLFLVLHLVSSLVLLVFFFVFLQRIRTALRSVRDEIRTMDLRMGVLQSQILSLQMRGVRKQRVGRK